MDDESDESRLVSALLVEASDRPAEMAAIAVLADTGMLADEHFIKRCVDAGGPHVDWWAATDFAAGFPGDAPERASVLSAVAAWWRPPGSSASSLGDLQIVVDLEGATPPQLALWRDAFVADDPDLEFFHGHVELIVDELRRRGACWRCGLPGSATEDELPVCRACEEIA